MSLWERLTTGPRLHPWRFITALGLSYSVGWTVLEPVTALVGIATDAGPRTYLMLVALSLVAGFVVSARPSRVSFRPRATNFRLTLRFGDLFDLEGIKAIPFNDFFDVELGPPVSERSLHGQLIKRVWGGHPEALAARLDEVLPPDFERVPRDHGRTRRYEVGTTIRLDTGHGAFLLTALSRTDPTTHKAHATLRDLWTALEGLWARARETANGEPLVVPLFGGGLSGVGLPPQHLLQVLVISLIASVKKQEITPEITLVLHDDLFDSLDLGLIKKEWS